jgi:Domain of unknown function (DUF4440)
MQAVPSAIVSRILFAALAVTLSGGNIVHADADQAMIQADRAFVQAAAKADQAALEKLLDEGFTWMDFEGNTQTRAQVLRDLPKPAIPNQDAAQLKSYTYGDVGDVQASLGRLHVLRIWAKRSDGWKVLVYQEVRSLAMPPSFTPGAGKDCENPCKTVPYKPKNKIEHQVISAYEKLETAAMAHNSPVFATLVADEFVAASSNSDKLYDKRGRMEDFDQSKMGGVAPTPLQTARLIEFPGAVLMTSGHKPAVGKPLLVTRLWIDRNGHWVEALSYQTAVQAAVAAQ